MTRTSQHPTLLPLYWPGPKVRFQQRPQQYKRGDSVRGRLIGKAPSHLRGLSGEGNLIPFQDEAVRRESGLAGRAYVVFASTSREKPVRCVAGALAIIQKSCYVQLAMGIQLMPCVLTPQGVFVGCTRVCWSKIKKQYLFHEESYMTQSTQRPWKNTERSDE